MSACKARDGVDARKGTTVADTRLSVDVTDVAGNNMQVSTIPLSLVSATVVLSEAKRNSM